MHKQQLISTLKNLKDLTQEQKSYLIDLVNTKKKYGLVWEDKPEDVEERLRQHLPVLTEVPERRVVATAQVPTAAEPAPAATPKAIAQGTLSFATSVKSEQLSHDTLTDLPFSSKEKGPGGGPSHGEVPPGVATPDHILIEGDNLHALTALTFTHEGRVDVIYIDPPYNTGNKDFKYNDRFVDREDTYRHSKWLSFMHKRLLIAKRLLAETGVIFISIDDNEQAQLKMLCDEVFTESCHVATIPVIMNLKGNPDNYGFSDTHEYCLVYTKFEKGCDFGSFGVDEEALESEWTEDDFGLFKRADTLRRTGQDAARERRPKGWFPIFINSNNDVYVTENDQPDNPEDYILWPINEDNIELSWTWSKKKIIDEPYNLIVINGRNGKNIYKKQRPQLGDLPTKKPKSIFYKPEYSTSTSTNDLKKILGSKKFDAPKPVYFINDLVKIGGNSNALILDFFAGSGTTLHATMQLNAEDGRSGVPGTRQCILVTNNENNIAEEVCYERNKRVIQGYTNAKGQAVPGLTNNNLRYYRCETVPRQTTLPAKRLLMQRATELLCIKEGLYEEVPSLARPGLARPGLARPGLSLGNQIRAFGGKQGTYLLVIYDDLCIEEAVALISQTVATEAEARFKVYVFSNGQYPYTEEFEEVLPYVTLCALPDALYKAYRQVLPAEQAPARILEEAEEGEVPDLFAETKN